MKEGIYITNKGDLALMQLEGATLEPIFYFLTDGRLMVFGGTYAGVFKDCIKWVSVL